MSHTLCLISLPEAGIIVGIAVISAIFAQPDITNPFISRGQKIVWILIIIVLNWIGLLWYYYTYYMKNKD